MKSLEKLREAANYPTGSAIRAIADEIEREITERYMVLPVDADGVPIRVGDIVKCTFADDNATVKYLSLQEDGWSVVVEYPDGRGHRTPESMRHVNPRTVEDVLEEFVQDVRKSDAEFISEQGSEAYLLAAMHEAAAEIRELLGGEGE